MSPMGCPSLCLLLSLVPPRLPGIHYKGSWLSLPRQTQRKISPGPRSYACVNGSGQVPDPSNEQTTISTVRAPAQPFTADENGNISGSLTLGPPTAESNTLVCPPGQTERLQSVAYSKAVASTVASTSATATPTASSSP
jgi:hypothetical protein